MTLLQLGYFGLMVIVTIIAISFGFTAINKTFETDKAAKKKRLLVIGLIVWHTYIYLMASSGFIYTLSFPPRFALTMIIPSFIFTGVFVSRNRKSDWILNLPTSKLFFFQSFRILVELLFVASVSIGLLHKEASIEGYNYDMVYALTVPIVGYIAFSRKTPNLKLVRIWNYVGLAVLATVIFVFMTTIYRPQMYGATEPMMPLEATTYPYVLVAGFLMPIAVFIHVLSIAQLNRLIK